LFAATWVIAAVIPLSLMVHEANGKNWNVVDSPNGRQHRHGIWSALGWRSDDSEL